MKVLAFSKVQVHAISTCLVAILLLVAGPVTGWDDSELNSLVVQKERVRKEMQDAYRRAESAADEVESLRLRGLSVVQDAAFARFINHTQSSQIDWSAEVLSGEAACRQLDRSIDDQLRVLVGLDSEFAAIEARFLQGDSDLISMYQRAALERSAVRQRLNEMQLARIEAGGSLDIARIMAKSQADAASTLNESERARLAHKNRMVELERTKMLWDNAVHALRQEFVEIGERVDASESSLSVEKYSKIGIEFICIGLFVNFMILNLMGRGRGQGQP